MKNLMLFSALFLFVFTGMSHAQNDTIWYDTNWKITTKNKASYYRPHCEKKGNGYWFVDYYISGKKQMEGLSLDKNREVYDGEVKWYYENGHPFQFVHYKNGTLEGKRQIFHENGKLKSVANYKNGKIEGKFISYFDNGNTASTGDYRDGQKTGHWKTFYPDGKLESEGVYTSGKKTGIWKTHYYDGSEQKI